MIRSGIFMILETAGKQRKIALGRVGSRNARARDFYFLSATRASRSPVVGIFHRGTPQTTRKGKKQRSSGTGWQRWDALSRRNGRRDDSTALRVRYRRRKLREWNGVELNGEYGVVPKQSEMHVALSVARSRSRGVLSPRRTLTFTQELIPTTSYTARASVSRSITTHSTLIYDTDAISLLPARR